MLIKRVRKVVKWQVVIRAKPLSTRAGISLRFSRHPSQHFDGTHTSLQAALGSSQQGSTAEAAFGSLQEHIYIRLGTL